MITLIVLFLTFFEITHSFTFSSVKNSQHGITSSFVGNQSHRDSHLKNSKTNTNRKAGLSMYLDDVDIDPTILKLAVPLLSTSLDLGSLQQLGPASVSDMVGSDPTLKVEMLTNMAHLSTDIASFFVRDTSALRLLEVFGRLFAMGADYVPDHVILGDEFVFQIVMLAFASKGLFNSLSPRAASVFATTSKRDMRAYLVMFRQTGLTWMQYKSMKALAFDWVDVEPGQIITSDEHHSNLSSCDGDENIYCLYRGEALVQSNGKHLQTVIQDSLAPKLDGVHSMALLGEMSFARQLHSPHHFGMRSKKTNKKTDKKTETTATTTTTTTNMHPSNFPKTTIKAGPAGATLLRINTSKLTVLMDNDAQLARSIRCLLMTGMQEKLTLHLSKSRQEVEHA